MSNGLNGIFNNGVAGMLAFTQGMGAVSDNIANQNTVGYKRVETLFSSVLGRTEQAARISDTTASTLRASNTQGVRPVTRQLVDVQGAVQITNRQYDLAISGSGMFVFGVADPESGEITSHVFSRAGDLDPVMPSTIQNGTLNTSTEAYLANKNGNFLLGLPITEADLLAPTLPASFEELEAIQVGDQAAFAGEPTTTATLAAVIPAAGATTVTTPIFYTDSNGDQQSLTVQFSNPVVVSGVSTTWDITILDSNGATVSTLPGGAVFDSTGQLPTGATLSITAGGTTFDVDMEDVTMLGDATGTSVQAIQVGYTHNGVPAGAFEGLIFREDGVIFGRYSGGATQPLYRLPVVLFNNPNALQQLAGNEYALTADAGDPAFAFLGGDTAKLVLNAVEASNVDLADSFSQMIIVQRAYSSAATVVRTADEMSTTVRDLMR